MNSAEGPRLRMFCERFGVAAPFDTERIRAGRNSEVSLLSNSHGKWILKHYHQHAIGTRDRLGTEFGFLKFLQDCGVARVPRPLGADHDLCCGLYTFLPGKRPDVIVSAHITQAARFVREINQHRRATNAQRLPKAADACMNWQDHLDSTGSRIRQLLEAVSTGHPEIDAQSFVRDTLLAFWEDLEVNFPRNARSGRAATPGEIGSEYTILSPSDFGFHNVLENEGQLSFVDFEYAGWDDPAKLICDFICQPELPVSDSQGRQFLDELVVDWPEADTIRHRVEHLLPVHRVKWCCIMMNEFKLEDRRRRAHAGVATDGLLVRQLDKAKRYFETHLASTN